MIYTVVSVLLVVAILLYFRIADRYNIIDKPNERSSHSSVTIRGGGIIFPIAILLWFLFFGFQYPWFTLGVLLISVISFLDDILTLSTKPRLAIHLLSVALLMYDLGIYSFPAYWWIIAFVLIIGWINAFNFMDGINGITAFYAISVLIPVGVYNMMQEVLPLSLILISAISAVIFAFFNARKKAKTFAGDVGSVSMAFIIAFLLITIILATGRWEFICFVAVYGVDAVLTIIHRLSKKENIFKPHRSHLYQYLANEMKVPHIGVAALYAFLQLMISFVVIKLIDSQLLPLVAFSILVVLSVIYTFAKSRILRTIKA
ncbi:MraY family glycosyltransferase [Owenweeksia hongkongensis]|uniref:UDP-N-acetylmuramyl pentapeptide phosphotransferase/UDP-N-acetylglucosamine-1-phosphate transferase n=1 Tax=Owenweeksia hongkongensis (strain DSM 17368 / CIP 108786 / JCM 12287 / NRRL B-23963 / UST20020801) TaxID=926562 RepID=G8R4V3_OWEHD|nr:glycosyltransferase family 4 protein [Owenweeksia hongkongensis]AEV34267.1 UDP-N-acetylmuramyl pentapeptide phosphotransferase/UDP-N-acetylglucosamine-1-phosphate transferase [Owenweeksia hongkongensis DSM 17368]